MNIRVILWMAIGIAAGVTHAISLWRSTHGHTRQPWAGVWRLPVVAVVLIVAALAHALLSAVVGWFVGLTGASVVCLARKRPWM